MDGMPIVERDETVETAADRPQTRPGDSHTQSTIGTDRKCTAGNPFGNSLRPVPEMRMPDPNSMSAEEYEQKQQRAAAKYWDIYAAPFREVVTDLLMPEPVKLPDGVEAAKEIADWLEWAYDQINEKSGEKSEDARIGPDRDRTERADKTSFENRDRMEQYSENKDWRHDTHQHDTMNA